MLSRSQARLDNADLYFLVVCNPGEHWHECAIECNRTCQYYDYILTKEGTCGRSVGCVPGCVPDTRVECQSSNSYWRDRFTCVDRSHCLCKTEEGEPISPGATFKASECKICQCINNYYSCDDSSCQKNENQVIEDETIITNITR
jgi:von Willebrand factor